VNQPKIRMFGSFCVNCERYDYEELRMAVNSFICRTVNSFSSTTTLLL